MCFSADLAFNVRVRKGAMENVAGLEEEIKKHFALTVQVGQSAMEYGLDELGDALSMENGPSMHHAYGTWKYNLDGTQITYSIHEAEGQQTGKLDSALAWMRAITSPSHMTTLPRRTSAPSPTGFTAAACFL